MRKILAVVAAFVMLGLALEAGAVTPAPKKTAPKRTGSQAAANNASKESAARPAAGKASASRGGSKAGAKLATWRNRQTAPTPERYKEIQNALAVKGYLKPDDVTGKWDESSQDAMKKFQADQNLDASGKLNSLSLIALGLGPKRETPAGTH